jgi:hypothetical protein
LWQGHARPLLLLLLLLLQWLLQRLLAAGPCQSPSAASA